MPHTKTNTEKKGAYLLHQYLVEAMLHVEQRWLQAGELVFQVSCKLLSAMDGVPCTVEMLPHAEKGQIYDIYSRELWEVGREKIQNES